MPLSWGYRTALTAAFRRTAKTAFVVLAVAAVSLFLPLLAAKDALAYQSVLLSGSLIISPGLLSVLSIPDEGSPNQDFQDSTQRSFTTVVSISFRLEASARATIEIRDETGMLVKELLTSTELEAGPHSFTWDGRNASGEPAPGGTYLVILRVYGLSGGFQEKTGKLTVRTARSLELSGYKSFQYHGAFIDGHAGAFSGGTPGSSLEQALALEAEGYATPRLYVRGSYDDAEGPSLRQFMVAYEGEKVQASAGDLAVGYPEQEFTLRERSVFGGQISGSFGNDRLSPSNRLSLNNRFDLILARVDATSAILRRKGDGITSTYWLNAPVIPGSERISIRNRQLTREVDYVIDYGSGELALWRPVPYDEELVVVYEYLPGHKFYRQDLFGVRARTALSGGAEFAFNAVRLGDELTPVDQAATTTTAATAGTAAPALPPPAQLWNYDLNGQSRLWNGDLILAGEWAESRYSSDWRNTSWFAASGEPGSAYQLQLDLARGRLRMNGNLRRVNQDFRGIAAGDLQTGVEALSLQSDYQAWPFLGFVSGYSARTVFPAAGAGQPEAATQSATGSAVSTALGSYLKLAGVSRMPASFPEIEVNLTRSLRSLQSLPLAVLLAQPFPALGEKQPLPPFDSQEEGVGLGIHQATGKIAYALNLGRMQETSLATTNPALGAATKWSASLGAQFQPAESVAIASKLAAERKFGAAFRANPVLAAGTASPAGPVNGSTGQAELARREDMDLTIKFGPWGGFTTTAGLENFLAEDHEAGLSNQWFATRLGVEKALSENLYAGLEGSRQKRWSRQEQTATGLTSDLATSVASDPANGIPTGMVATDGQSDEIKASLRCGRLARLSGAIRQKSDQTRTEGSQETRLETSLDHAVTVEYSPKSGMSLALERRDSQEEKPGSGQPDAQITWILRGTAQAGAGLTFNTSLENTAKNSAAQAQMIDRNLALGVAYSVGAGVQLSAEYRWANRLDFWRPDKGYTANLVNLGVTISF